MRDMLGTDICIDATNECPPRVLQALQRFLASPEVAGFGAAASEVPDC